MKIEAVRRQVARAGGKALGEAGDMTFQERREYHSALGRTVRPAGVLILLIERDDALSVVLTQRTAHLHDHAGQISFPGGRYEPEDADIIATALRESAEEIGTDSSRIQVVGTLLRTRVMISDTSMANTFGAAFTTFGRVVVSVSGK